MPKGLSPTRLRQLECAKDSEAVLTNDDIKRNAEAGGDKLHFCFDWDGMVIDNTDPEFEGCHCFTGDGPSGY